LATPGSTNEGKGVYLEVEGDINESLYAKSITAYREAKSSGAVDLDGTPLSILSFYSEWDQSQWSQEFQLSGTVNDDLDWITGLYYFTEDSGDFSTNRFGGPDAYTAFGVPAGVPQGTNLGAPFGALTVTSNNDAQHTNTSYGGFAQANYHFTEKLRATLGFRYTFDRRETVIKSLAVEPGQPAYPGNDSLACKINPASLRDDGVSCKKTQIANFQYPAWTFGMDYQALDNLFLYAKTSGASMAGGWNFRSSDNPSFDPENVRDVEVGFKSDLFDGTLRFNGALFYEKATNQQRAINVAVGVTPVQFIQNAGQSQATGAELELTWLPWQGMQINTSLALLNMNYEKYESQEKLSAGAPVGAGTIVTLDRSSEHAPHAPDKTLSIGATQTFNTPIGDLDLHVDYHYVDETWFQDSTVNPLESAAVQAIQTEEKKHNSIPAYGLVNAQATFRTTDKHWEAALYVKNLTDKEYYTGVSNFWDAFGTASRYYGDPRTFGGSVRYNF
jgi:iron complex outermembrane receptor protein